MLDFRQWFNDLYASRSPFFGNWFGLAIYYSIIPYVRLTESYDLSVHLSHNLKGRKIIKAITFQILAKVVVGFLLIA